MIFEYFVPALLASDATAFLACTGLLACVSVVLLLRLLTWLIAVFVSFVLLPGITTLPPVMLAIMYCVALFWMFLGMNIIADVFME